MLLSDSAETFCESLCVKPDCGLKKYPKIITVFHSIYLNLLKKGFVVLMNNIFSLNGSIYLEWNTKHCNIFHLTMHILDKKRTNGGQYSLTLDLLTDKDL